MGEVIVRPYRPEDRAAVRRICFDTGLMGGSIAAQYRDFESFADMFSAYCTDEEPENGLIAEVDGQVAGYMLCSLDERRVKGPAYYALKHALLRGACFRPGTFRFYARSVMDSLGDLVSGRHMPKIDADLYPSQPHLNLLASARRGGLGYELFCRAFDLLASRGSKGIHAYAHATNRAVIDLGVNKLGFRPICEPYPIPGLRTPDNERMKVQVFGRSLTDWEIGAWQKPRAKRSVDAPRT